MTHVVLLGDSVFDNAAYVGGGPDVVHQLREVLGANGQATLLARDGGVIAGIEEQAAGLPADATHLVVSVGGNDALGAAPILGSPARSVAEVLMALADIQSSFAARYEAMARRLAERNLPLALSTIYDPRYPDPQQRRIASTALAVLNDAITRTAFARGAALLDLRLICNEDADFANPIEPSTAGGAKIAQAISRFVQGRSASRVIL